MPIQLSSIRWVRVIVTAVLVCILIFALLFVVVTVYATLLGFQARGAPDPVQISQFANQVGPWAGPIIAILLTLLAGIWLGRREGAAGPTNGLAMGVLAALLKWAIGFSFSLPALATLVLTAAAGWAGGRMGGNMRRA